MKSDNLSLIYASLFTIHEELLLYIFFLNKKISVKDFFLKTNCTNYTKFELTE